MNALYDVVRLRTNKRYGVHEFLSLRMNRAMILNGNNIPNYSANTENTNKDKLKLILTHNET